MSKIRVLAVSHSSNYGGCETDFGLLLEHLHASGDFEVYGAFPPGTQYDYFASLCADHVDSIGNLPSAFNLKSYIGFLFRLARQIKCISKAIRDFNIDLVVTPTSVLLGPLIAAGKEKKPAVVFVRELITPARLRKRVFKFLAGRASVVVVVSKEVEREFRPASPTADVRLIYDGVDLAGIAPRTTTTGPVRVGVIGTLLPIKGQNYFLEAAAALSQVKDISFYLVGQEDKGNEQYARELHSAVKRFGLEERVTFTGRLADIEEAYNLLDIVVIPSISEGIPLVLLESMSRGMPVVASNVGGIPEVIVEGESGFLVEAGDVGALAARIERLAVDVDLRAKIGVNARRRVRERFSLEASMAQLDTLLKEIAAKGARR